VERLDFLPIFRFLSKTNFEQKINCRSMFPIEKKADLLQAGKKLKFSQSFSGTRNKPG
jgi:hypothetical protein